MAWRSSGGGERGIEQEGSTGGDERRSTGSVINTSQAKHHKVEKVE